MYTFNIGSSNWDSIFDIDVVDANGNIVLNVMLDYTIMNGEVGITLANYDDTLPHTSAHAFYASVAAQIEEQIQDLHFNEN